MTNGSIKMVVTDLDDTLLSREKEISVEAAALIRSLKERGVLFTFITGRPPFSIKKFAEKVCISAPVVACNGALIIGRNGKPLMEGVSLPLGPLTGLLDKAKDKGLTVLVLAGEIEYALAETDWTRIRKESGRLIPVAGLTELSEQDNIYKVNIMADSDSRDFSSLLPGLRGLDREYSITVYGSTGCEIVSRRVNKQTGLMKLCGLCQVEPKEVLAIGDNENDVRMLQAAGVGAAVGNAAGSAKKAADYICKNTYTEGVVEAIRKFVL